MLKTYRNNIIIYKKILGKNFKLAVIGTTIRVLVPDIDTDRRGTRHILVVITEVKLFLIYLSLIIYC